MRQTLALPVSESSQVGEARRIASALADRAGFDEVGRGRVALVATELAGNLARHAQRGELVISVLRVGASAGVELLSIDRGPGVADFARCLVDGYTTAGTPGTGLGAVARHSDEFDAHSTPGQGTVLVARLWAAKETPSRPGGSLEVGAICLPVAGEQECGDAWGAIEPAPGRTLLMVADGLGHGPLAAIASDAAVASLRAGAGPGSNPPDAIRDAHRALKGTRGAAVPVALVDHEARQVRFAGVGNITATVIGPDARHGLVSHNGTVGLEVRKVQEFVQPWVPGSILLMHSDGLTSQARLERHSPLASRHPAVVAGVLYRDFARARDDATAVVARDGGA